MTEMIRTPDAAFDKLTDFPFAPHYHQWHDLRMHYLDEEPKDGPVMLLVHGMPTWSYLYRTLIPELVDAGYRCIAPDHMGFGRSDKPTDAHWFTIARHTEVLTSLIVALDLRNVTLLCQDWGGPTGLAQAAMMPERFARLTIMNTWLHHEGFAYTDAIRAWNKHWREGGLFCRETPNVGALPLLSAGLIETGTLVQALIENHVPDVPNLSDEAALMYAGYSAPHRGLDDAAFNGLRRFPLSIPLHNDDSRFDGNGAAQALHYRTLLEWRIPVHFIWGCADDVFTEQWGRQWASRMPGATFGAIPDAGHFLQNTHGPEIVQLLLHRIAEE
jgi:haloalkane dehalogenase